MGETTFIYGLYDPRSNKLRYIGKANNPQSRLNAHIKEVNRSSNSHKNNWIRGLIKDGLVPSLEILEEVPIDEWEKYERQWINKAKEDGINLVNSTIGGEGVKGHSFTEEHRRKLGAVHKGQKAWNLGIPPSEETRQKISRANKGHKMSEEVKKNLAESVREGWRKRNYKPTPKQLEAARNRNYIIKEETREKLGQASLGNEYGKLLAGKPKSEEHKRKISISNKGKIFTEEHRNNLSKSAKERLKSEDLRKRLSEANKGKQLGNKNALGYRHTEETKARISKTQRDKSRRKHEEELEKGQVE